MVGGGEGGWRVLKRGAYDKTLAELYPTFSEPPLTIRLKLSHTRITRCKRWRGVEA
jgi:hypothetical protein